MPPPMPRTVTISTPGPSTVDPVTGNERPGTSTTATVPAWLSQRPVADVGSQIELLATQNTTISLWTLLVPVGTVLTSKSSFTDESGQRYVVVGQPANRPDFPPHQFRAAAARLISDMQ